MHSKAACTSLLPSYTYWNPYRFVRHYLAVYFWEVWLPMFTYTHGALSSSECTYCFLEHSTCPCALSDTKAILHRRVCSTFLKALMSLPCWGEQLFMQPPPLPGPVQEFCRIDSHAPRFKTVRGFVSSASLGTACKIQVTTNS